MEVATLKKKKTSISKGKLKKTIKNVLCRPDPVFWPVVSEEHGKVLETALNKYRVTIPELKKPHWKELQLIPKDERPKPEKIQRVEGLIFGISECSEAVHNRKCSAVIIESTVNPRSIVQPLLEKCISTKVPVVCLNGLRKTTSSNFGIPTSCLAINDILQDLKTKISDIAMFHSLPQALATENTPLKMDLYKDNMKTQAIAEMENKSTPQHPYLFRTNKKSRVFNPSSEEYKTKSKKTFVGIDFIEFSDKPDRQKPYMKMILKRITNNQNRTKRK